MSIRGCMIMTPSDAEEYISYTFKQNLPVAIIQKYPFIRVQNIRDIYDHCRPHLEYIRRYIGDNRRAYMVELNGLSHIGLNLVQVDAHCCWLKKCDDYSEEIDYINGDAE